MRTFTLLLIFVLALGATAPGQVALVLDDFAPGIVFNADLPSAAYPVGAPSFIGPLPLPLSGALMPGSFPGGGLAVDPTTSYVYATDGAMITMEPHPAYLPFSPGPPVLIGPVPAPAILGGPITGIDVDPAAGVVWMCDPIGFAPFPLFPPFVALAPPIPFPVATPGGPLTGIAWDGATGSLWFCDAGGAVYNITPGGVPIGPQPVAFVPTAGPPICGIDMNKGVGPGSFPPPFCSAQIPGGMGICITDGVVVYDAIPGVVAPIPLAGPPSLMGGKGLDCGSDFQITAGAAPGGCLSSGAFMLPGLAMPAFVGPGALNALRLTGATPGTAGFLLADICPLPGGLAVGATGEVLGINPLSPGYSLTPVLTDATGNVAFPVGLVVAPPGFQFSFQWAVADPMHPLGYCLSDTVTVTLGLP
ncbi:MAG TPA: hypothetical protein ENK43_01260 [Planctomycetes bacterium]|nr:hypothetical protein [Planctomycetota bacterium]